jgi:hypothetical protein
MIPWDIMDDVEQRMLDTGSFYASVPSFHDLCEQVALPAKSIQSAMQTFKEFFVSERSGFMQGLQMIGGLITGSQGIKQEADEFLLVASSSIALKEGGFY